VKQIQEAGRAARARDAWSTAADWSWELARRIHLGTRKPENWVQLFKFGVVGVTGYAINLVVFGLLVGPLAVHHIAAAVGAFCVAVTNNFLLNRHWTFDAGHGHAGFQAARFFTVSVVALGVNLIVLVALVDIAGAPELASQAIAVATAMPVNFVGNKLWTFDRHRAP
jgi:putative flippase GtrA